MVTFSVSRAGAHSSKPALLRFSVTQLPVLIAGSQGGSVDSGSVEGPLGALRRAGFPLMVGCRGEVSACFRSVVVASGSSTDAPFADCPMADRALCPLVALKAHLTWMVKRCSFVLLFPDDPRAGRWERDSVLAYRAALDRCKPVFLVSVHPPRPTARFYVLPSDLFGVVRGFWMVPRSLAASGEEGQGYGRSFPYH